MNWNSSKGVFTSIFWVQFALFLFLAFPNKAFSGCMSDAAVNCEQLRLYYLPYMYPDTGICRVGTDSSANTASYVGCDVNGDLLGHMRYIMCQKPSDPDGHCASLPGTVCEARIPGGCAATIPAPPPVKIHRPSCEVGSVIAVENRSVSESISLVGVPHSISYSSDRVIGRVDDYTVRVPLTGATITPGLSSVRLVATLGSATIHDNTYSSLTTNQTATFSVSPSALSGVGANEVAISYTQDLSGSSTQTNDWNDYFDNSLTRNSTFASSASTTVGSYRAKKWEMGGWTFDVHHFYDTVLNKLHEGSGRARYVQAHPFKFDGDATDFLAVSSQDDGAEIYIFDLTGKHIKTLNGLTGKIILTFLYDGSSRLLSITDAYGNVTTLQRNGSGLLTGILAPRGQLTTVSLDSNGYLESVTNPNSEEFEMTYSSGGLLLTFEKPSGAISTMDYDTLGLLESDSSTAGSSLSLSAPVLDALTGITTFSTATATGKTKLYSTQPLGGTGSDFWFGTTVNNPDLSVSTRNSRELRTENEVNEPTLERRIFQVEDFVPSSTWNGPRTDYNRYTLKSLGYGNDLATWFSSRNRTYVAGTNSVNILSTPDIFQYASLQVQDQVNGNTWTSTYDASLQKTTVQSPLGRLNYVTTDEYGKTTSTQWATFSPVNYSYDANGRLDEITQNTRTTEFTYNSAGYLHTVKNALNQTTTFTYDNAGRVATQTFPDTRVLQYSYDANGNLTGVTPPGKPLHEFIFNLFDLIASYIAPVLGLAPSTTTYAYNNDKKVTEIERPNGDDIEFTYDATTGILTGITTTDGNYVFNDPTNSNVDNRGRTTPDGIQDNIYWLEGQPVAYKMNELTGSNPGFVVGYHSRYGTNLKPVHDWVYGPSDSYVYYTYDNDGALSQAGSLVISRDSTTGLLSGTDLGDVEDSYTYSANYPEVATYSASYTGGTPATLFTQSFTRDALGRISQKSETVGATTHTYDYTYDSSGRLTTVLRDSSPYGSYTYDTNGNRTSGTIQGTAFTGTYNNQDRLTATNTETFTYNDNGELTQRTVTASSAVTSYAYNTFGDLKTVTLPSSDTLQYRYDSLRRRAIRVKNSVITDYYVYSDQYKIAAILDENRLYKYRVIYGTKANVPDYIHTYTDTYRLISDERGSVRLVVNIADGSIAQALEYDEYGNVISDTSPGFQPFGFAGCLYDHEAKLCHFGAREYDASIGRWMQKDPILFGGQQSNLFGYSFNDPINYIDTDGRLPAIVLAPLLVGTTAGLVAAGTSYLAGGTRQEIKEAFGVAFAGGALAGFGLATSLGAVLSTGLGVSASLLTALPESGADPVDVFNGIKACFQSGKK
jgi:RHS repeat-associated protein